MLDSAVRAAGLSELFDAVLSADAVKVFKPHPRVYAYGLEQLGLRADQVSFQSSNAWDAYGASQLRPARRLVQPLWPSCRAAAGRTRLRDPQFVGAAGAAGAADVSRLPGRQAAATPLVALLKHSPWARMAQTLELGLDTFGDVTEGADGQLLSHAEVIRNVVDEAVLADRLGVDFFGVGEHHRADFAISAPDVVLAAVAGRTSRIRLGSAVTVLSSDDPIRVFQRFSTLDAASNGRAEVILGRGSFTESFPLFGYQLSQYDKLFSEKLDLFVKLSARRGRQLARRNAPASHRPARIPAH